MKKMCNSEEEYARNCKIMEQNSFLVDVIYNHKYLEKILGLLKSIKKKDSLSKILETCKNDIKEEEENFEIFLNEVNNFTKCDERKKRVLYENLKDSSSSPSLERVNIESDGELSTVDKNKHIRIYADGVFDLVHSGHFNAIRQAKKLGDALVVGINSDEEVLKCKGFSPIYTEEERGELIRGCKWVDEVIVGTQYCVDMELLNKYNCDYAAHGNDLACDANGTYCYENVKKNDRLKIFERSYGVSSTAFVKHLLQAMEKSGNANLGKKLYVKESNEYKNGYNTTTTITNNNICDNSNNDNTSLISAKGEITKNGNNMFEKENEPLKEVEKNDTGYNMNTAETNTTTERTEEEYQSETAEIEKFKKAKSLLNKNKCYVTASKLYQFTDYDEKKKRNKVVYVDGSFDIFHVGHLRILENAKKLGDFLIVGVHDDEVVRKIKGEYFPVVSLLERTLNVLSMKVVDDVVIGAPWIITESFIKIFNIHTVVRGTKVDYVYLNNEIDPYKIPKALNIYKEISSESSITTFEIIERIENKKIYLKNTISQRCKKEENIWRQMVHNLSLN